MTTPGGDPQPDGGVGLAAPAPGPRQAPSRGSRSLGPTDDVRATLALVGLLALAALLRLREAAGAPLWTDEIITLWMARLPLPDLLRTVASDVHPSLHFLLVKAWRAIGGESSLWIKSLSVLFGVALVGLMVPVGRSMFGRVAGWVAAALLAVHASHLYVSQESRFYSLLWVWLVGAVWMAWRRVEGGGRGSAIGLLACVVGALYTHYLSLVVLGFLGLWGVLVLWSRPRELAGWIGIFALAGVAFLPQLPTFLHQLGANTTAHWVRAPDLGNLLDLSRKVSFVALYLAPVVATLCALPLTRPAQHLPASLLWMVSLGPVLLCWELTRAGMHIYTERYMLFAVPFVCLLGAAGLAELSPRVRAAGIVVLFAAGLRTALIRPAFREAADQEAAAEWLAARASPRDTIYHADTHSLFFFRHHHAGLGTHLLVWWVHDVPYYEGGPLIPREWIVPGHSFDSLAASGHWWGVSTVQGGTNPAPTHRRFDVLGDRVGPALERVTLWRGKGLARPAPP